MVTDLANLHARALSPTLFAHRVPLGVLSDVGYGLREMPATTAGGGYEAMMYNDLDAFDAYLIAPLRADPNTLNKTALQALKAAITGTYGALNMSELPTVYAEGSSLILQNTVLQCKRIGGVDGRYDIRPDITAIKAAMDPATRLFAHLGACGVAGFDCHEINFLVQYAQQHKVGKSQGAIVAVNAAVYPLAGSRKYIPLNGVVGADFQVKSYYAPQLDIFAPGFVTQDLAHIAEVVTAFGTTIGYVLFGENTNALRSPGATGCEVDNKATVCVGCEPATSYPDTVIVGLQRYLTKVLGFNDGDLVTRWIRPPADSIAALDLTVQIFCPGSPQGLDAWNEFVRFKTLALRQHEYAKAKETNVAARVSSMSFGFGMEDSWLGSDYGSVGDWLNDEASYLASGRWPMQDVTAFAKLSGEPPLFAISCPPGTIGIPGGQGAIPPILQVHRTLSENNARWWLRDVFCSGGGHLCYRRGIGFSFEFHAPSAATISDLLADVRALQPASLEQNGPYQKIALHVENTEFFHTDDYDITRKNPAGRTADFLTKALRARHVTYALCSELSRVMGREFSLAHLKREILVSLYPSSAKELSGTLADTYPTSGIGAAVIVVEQGTPEGNVASNHVLAASVGTLHQVSDSNGALSKCFVFKTRPGSSCEGDFFFNRLADSLNRVVIPYLVANQGAAISSMPFVDKPVVVTTTYPSIFSNFVTDGVNFIAIVSNMGPATAAVDVTIDARVATGLDVTYPTRSLSLDPGESDFAVLEATTSGITVATCLTDATTRLGVLNGLGYNVADGTSLITKATALNGGGQPARALAAYLAAVRMVYVKTSYSIPTLTVNARRIGLLGTSAGAKDVSAAVQVFFQRNQFEIAAQGLTTGSGDFSASIGFPAQKYWSLADNDFITPPLGARAALEIHVVDRATADGTKVVRSI